MKRRSGTEKPLDLVAEGLSLLSLPHLSLVFLPGPNGPYVSGLGFGAVSDSRLLCAHRRLLRSVKDADPLALVNFGAAG